MQVEAVVKYMQTKLVGIASLVSEISLFLFAFKNGQNFPLDHGQLVHAWGQIIELALNIHASRG